MVFGTFERRPGEGGSRGVSFRRGDITAEWVDTCSTAARRPATFDFPHGWWTGIIEIWSCLGNTLGAVARLLSVSTTPKPKVHTSRREPSLRRQRVQCGFLSNHLGRFGNNGWAFVFLPQAKAKAQADRQ